MSASTLRIGEHEFCFRSDEFSIQLSLRGENKFWVRVGRNADKRVIFSDFSRSKVSDQVMVDAMILAIGRVVGAAEARELLFQNIVPPSLGLARSREEAGLEAGSIRRIVSHYAQAISLRVARATLEERVGKFDLLVVLEEQGTESNCDVRGL